MGQTNAKPESLEEIAETTHFTPTEVQEYYKAFLRDCPDGFIDKKDFMKTYTMMFPNGDPRKFAEYVFKTLDLTGDGRISFREFMSAMSISARGTFEQKMEYAFRIYDLDGNGYISRLEMLEIVTAMYKLYGDGTKLPNDKMSPEERVDKIFRIQDHNRDGQLSLHEFIEAARDDPAILKAMNIS